MAGVATSMAPGTAAQIASITGWRRLPSALRPNPTITTRAVISSASRTISQKFGPVIESGAPKVRHCSEFQTAV